MRHFTSTMSHRKGETTAMKVTYLIKRLPVCTSILFKCSNFMGKQHSSELIYLTLLNQQNDFCLKGIVDMYFLSGPRRQGQNGPSYVQNVKEKCHICDIFRQIKGKTGSLHSPYFNESCPRQSSKQQIFSVHGLDVYASWSYIQMQHSATRIRGK